MHTGFCPEKLKQGPFGRRRQSRKDNSEKVEWKVMELIRLHLNAGQWRVLEKVMTNSWIP
jgi:hypothetical protein